MGEYAIIRVTAPDEMHGLVTERIHVGPQGFGKTWVAAWKQALERRQQYGGIWVVGETPRAFEPRRPAWPRKRPEIA